MFGVHNLKTMQLPVNAAVQTFSAKPVADGIMIDMFAVATLAVLAFQTLNLILPNSPDLSAVERQAVKW
jgi:hypothetical protein